MRNSIFLGFLLVLLVFVSACTSSNVDGNVVISDNFDEIQQDVMVDNTASVDSDSYADSMKNSQKLVLEDSKKSSVVDIDMVISDHGFEPEMFSAKLGDTVRISITSLVTDSASGLQIDGYDVSIPFGDSGRAGGVVEFVADKKGDFFVHCADACSKDWSGLFTVQ